MGISLTGLTPATTYDALIKVGDNGPITGALKVLSDGLGTNLPMEASTTGVNFTGTTTVGGVAVANTTQLATKQDTLVSGTNIKTINSTSLLGSGNIAVVTSPSGVAGAIQFSNGSAFASDATNLFWDDTNNRLGVGTNSPTATIQSKSAGDTNATLIFKGENSSGNERLSLASNGQLILSQTGNRSIEVNPGGYVIVSNYTAGFNVTSRIVAGSGSALAAQMGVVGSGSTSATTSLLVQNSSGTQLFKIADDGATTLGANNIFGRFYTNVAGAAYPAYSFNGNSQTGLFDLGAGGFGFGTANTERMRISNAGIGINTLAANNASAIFQVDSTTQGFLPPRMTTTQKNAIATPPAGLVVYDSTTNKLCCYNGSTWNDLF